MDFEYTPKVKDMQARLLAFMDEHIYPNEARFFEEIAENRAKGNAWVPTKIVEELKPKALAAGLWNLFLPKSTRAPQGLSNLEYAPLCEIMGRVLWAPEVFNCSAPDTGNMEVLERYGSDPLLARALGDDFAARRLDARHRFARRQAGGDDVLDDDDAIIRCDSEAAAEAHHGIPVRRRDDVAKVHARHRRIVRDVVRDEKEAREDAIPVRGGSLCFRSAKRNM